MNALHYLFLSSSLTCSIAMAQSDIATENSNEFHSFLSRVNDNSPLESAGSHGTLGYSLGVGFSKIDRPENNLFTSRFFDQQDDDSLTIPKIWITKGVFWPLDIGGYYGSITDTDIYTYGGYLQWTVFEEFALPAAALRYGYSEIGGAENTNFKSHKASLVGSWGFRFVTIFADISYEQSSMNLQSEDEAEITLLSEVNLNQTQVSQTSYPKQVGIQIAPFSPLTKITFALTEPNSDEAYYSAKVSMGL